MDYHLLPGNTPITFFQNLLLPSPSFWSTSEQKIRFTNRWVSEPGRNPEAGRRGRNGRRGKH